MVHTPILPAVRKLKQEKSKFEARGGYKNEILSKQQKKKLSEMAIGSLWFWNGHCVVGIHSAHDCGLSGPIEEVRLVCYTTSYQEGGWIIALSWVVKTKSGGEKQRVSLSPPSQGLWKWIYQSLHLWV